jgi:TIR domain
VILRDLVRARLFAVPSTGRPGVQFIEQDRGEAPRAAGDAGGPVPRRDVFISHASEDKDAIARPLAECLRARGCSVWFDEYELVLGDSLRGKIGDGLRHSRVGVVILSGSFFAKQWPKWELDGLTARHIAGEQRVILPVWHEVGLGDVRSYSPPLADLFAASSSKGVDAVADAVVRVLRKRVAGAGPQDALSEARFSPAAGASSAGSPAPSTLRADVSRAPEPTGLRLRPDGLWVWLPKARELGWVRPPDRRFVAELAFFAVLFILSYSIGASL